MFRLVKAIRKALGHISTEAKKLRIVGDVHAEAEKLQVVVDDALAKGYKLIFLGDLINKGSNNLGVMEIISKLVDDGNAEIVLGNHEKALLTWYEGKPVHKWYDLKPLLKEVEDAGDYGRNILYRFIKHLQNSYAWYVLDNNIFVHAVWDKKFLAHGEKPRYCDLTEEGKDFFGYACTGHKNYSHSKKFEPSPICWSWVHNLEYGEFVFVGHVSHKQVTIKEGRKGGKIIVLDTGAGKKHKEEDGYDGYISYFDLESLED